MGHVIVVVVAVVFAAVALSAAVAAAQERRSVRPVRTGQPPPAAGTPRDRWNKWLTVACICGLICAMACVALGFGR